MNVTGAATSSGLPEVIVKDVKKMRLVSEKTILALISHPLPPPVRFYSAEFMREMGLDDKDIAIMLRAFKASQDVRDFEADVIQKYKTKGHAYREISEEGYFPKDIDQELLVQALELK